MKDAQDLKSDTQGVVHFGERILYTKEFLQVWQSLPPQKQGIVLKKVSLLMENPDHRSLKVRHLQGNLYECYLMDSPPYRLWFEHQGDKIILVQIVARNTATHRTESPKAPHTAQPQKPYQEDFVVASTEKVMTAFLESEPQYENLYRRLADI